MEHPSPQLPPSTRLLFFKNSLLRPSCNVHNLPRELYRPRDRDGLYHEEATRLWVSGDDVSVTDCGNTTVETCKGQKSA